MRRLLLLLCQPKALLQALCISYERWGATPALLHELVFSNRLYIGLIWRNTAVFTQFRSSKNLLHTNTLLTYLVNMYFIMFWYCLIHLRNICHYVYSCNITFTCLLYHLWWNVHSRCSVTHWMKLSSSTFTVKYGMEANCDAVTSYCTRHD